VINRNLVNSSKPTRVANVVREEVSNAFCHGRQRVVSGRYSSSWPSSTAAS
jgi:hypothetical protein